MSVPGGDWREGAAYDYFDALEPEGVAFEFLRRNPEYETDVRSLTTAPAARAISDDPSVAAPALNPALPRWGLRFRGRSTPPRRPDPGPLAASRQPAPRAANGAALGVD